MNDPRTQDSKAEVKWVKENQVRVQPCIDGARVNSRGKHAACVKAEGNWVKEKSFSVRYVWLLPG